MDPSRSIFAASSTHPYMPLHVQNKLVKNYSHIHSINTYEWWCNTYEWWCNTNEWTHDTNTYGVATISRLLKTMGFFAKEPYKRDYILQKRPVILRSLLIVATS